MSQAREVCAPLARPRPRLDDQIEAMRDVVEVLGSDATFKVIAEGDGVPAKVLSAAFRAAAPGWVKRSHTITKIFQAAVPADEWRVVRNASNDTIVHFVRGDHLPEGFESVPPPTREPTIADPPEEW